MQRRLSARRAIAPSWSRIPLGLTHCIVAPEEPLGPAVAVATGGRGVDLVIDTIGGPALAETLKVMAMNGRLVNIGRMGGRMGELDMDRLSFFGLKMIGVSFRARSREQTLDCIEACAHDLLPHLASGAIKVPVERTYPVLGHCCRSRLCRARHSRRQGRSRRSIENLTRSNDLMSLPDD